MAIVTDPDLLNRNEIIYGTSQQTVSAFPVGAVVSGIFDPELTDGTTVSGFIFRSQSMSGVIAGIASGDILSIKTGDDAGHWQVDTVIDSSGVTVSPLDGAKKEAPTNWTTFPTAESLVYDIRQETGGNMADGATEQAVYSFSKEEWRLDTETFGSDDLIRHEFPFEPLTKESFEIGGGTSHDLWDWFTTDTKERVRTGGWDSVDAGSVKESTYAGVITLGALDSDAQVYYQPSGVTVDPRDFVLTGAVNQAIIVHDVLGQVEDGSYDTRTFLKLFVRKKARTYAGSSIGDIGVTTLENIVNRFPLTHVEDPAIVADDAEVAGHDPWAEFAITTTGVNGVTADIDTDTGTLTAAGETFITSDVKPGDVVEITGGTLDNEFFLVVSVDTETQLTLNTTEHGGFAGESSLTYETHRQQRIRLRVDDGAITQQTATSGILESTVGGFTASGVVIGDILAIREATPASSGLEGVYKILEINNDAEIGVNTTDQPFPSGTAGFIDYEIFYPGMFLQSKNNDVALGAHGDLTFTDANPDTITRAAGDWVADGVVQADLVTITGAANAANNASFVIREVTSATVITLDTQHALTTEGPVSATATVSRHFKRQIDSVLYPFLWRTFGNNAGLGDVFEFIQRELRRTTDIDNGPDVHRGDVTDLLMEFATPTGKGLNMFIDDFDINDTNNVSFDDASDTNRVFSFVSAGNILHNTNLQSDAGPAVVRMFFTSVPNGDFGTEDAVLVNDSTGTPVSYSVAGASRAFDFDYDNNAQGGRTPATDAAITIVAIGLESAQYVLFTGTITRATGLTFSLVSALERNYSTG